MRRQSWILWVMALAAAFGSSGMAWAATLSVSDSAPMLGTNWHDTIDIDKFDPGLGTLTSINFRLEGNVQGSIRFESMDAAAATVTTAMQARISLSRPNRSILVVTIPLANNVDQVSAFDGIIDFGGTSGRTYLGLTASTTDSVDTPPPTSDLELFTGPGTISLPIYAQGASTVTGAGNLITQFNTQAGAIATITYTYEPWPLGACCDPHTGDCVITTSSACSFNWLGEDVLCSVETCPAPPPEGACCNHLTGDCAILPQGACEFDWLGAGATCNVTTCPLPPPDGACCLPTGECVITMEADCAGVYWIAGGACSPNPCDQPPTGACCDEATGACTITTQAACAFLWLGDGVLCNDATCQTPVPIERASWGQIKNIYR